MSSSTQPDASLPRLSALWPPERDAVGASAIELLSATAADDLNVIEVIQAMVASDGPPNRLRQRERFARQVLSQLCQEAEVTAYRQDVLEDLLADEQLRERLRELLPSLEALSDVSSIPERFLAPGRESLDRISRRLGELELYVDTARKLHSALPSESVRSAGMRRIRMELDHLVGSERFVGLESALPALRATLSSIKSVTIGLNLGPDLAPESATILGFGAERIDGRQTLLGRLLGGWGAEQALTPLRRGERSPAAWQNDLARDLLRLLQDVATPVAAALRGYASVSVQALGRLGPELAFLLGGARLAERLQGAGLPTCRPQLLSAELRATQIEEAYDPVLVLRLLSSAADPGARVVTNPVTFDAALARVWVLSGPNRGGKTTYIRAVGLTHVLGQAGLHVAGRSGRLSAVDAIFTHFPSRETVRPGLGRLDEEAERLGTIFRQATPHSLILLNEALAGTSSFEAVDLATGVVRGLRFLGARAVYVTHLHELAAAVAEINATTPGDGLVGSLVAEPGAAPTEVQLRTFRIRPGSPHGQSFAAAIADQHGISFPQLLELLRQRGINAPESQSGDLV
ncbi:MAG: MutS-related protein [Chloroflexota bacterium]